MDHQGSAQDITASEARVDLQGEDVGWVGTGVVLHGQPWICSIATPVVGAGIL